MTGTRLEEARFVHAPWELAASSALTTALMSVVGATAPDLREHLGVSTAALTLAFVGQMLGAIAGSWLAGRARHRLLEVSPAGLLAAAALVVAALAPSLPVLVVAMGAGGVGAFCANAAAQAETMRRAGQRRAQALSEYHVWGGAGAAVFPLAVALLLAAGAPFQAAFLLVVAGYLGYAWINRGLRIVPPPRAAGERRPRLSARARWAVTAAVVGGGLQMTFPLYLASLVVDRFGVGAATGSATIGVYAFGVLVARAGGTRLLPRLPVDRQLRLGCALLLAGYALLGISGDVAGVMAASLLLGLGTGQLMPLGMARSARAIGDDRHATSVVFTFNSAMQLAVPGAVALLLQLTDLHTALLLTSPLALLVALAVWRSRPSVVAHAITAG
jgi:FSR family fosmidomycin resistance protein-like MFS transporter